MYYIIIYIDIRIIPSLALMADVGQRQWQYEYQRTPCRCFVIHVCPRQGRALGKLAKGIGVDPGSCKMLDDTCKKPSENR